MSNIAWSEQELANAAKRVAESMLTSFPSPSECEHVFSDDFEHSMEILRKKSKRRVVAHKIWQRAAVILIVTILSVSTWLTVDIQARERAFQWIKEIYESITIYLFNSEDNEIDHICYEPSWIPDGFSLVDNYQDISRHLAYDLINDGYIRGLKIGNAFRIPKVNVIEYVMDQGKSAI